MDNFKTKPLLKLPDRRELQENAVIKYYIIVLKLYNMHSIIATLDGKKKLVVEAIHEINLFKYLSSLILKARYMYLMHKVY